VAASNLSEKQSAQAPHGRRNVPRGGPAPGYRRPRAGTRAGSRWLKLAGLLLGLAVGLTVPPAVSSSQARAPAGQLPASAPAGRLPAGAAAVPAGGHPASLPASGGAPLMPRASLGTIPAALDAEWAGYSQRSTCADWAGGDGISAVRLSAAQIAWFFSDSFLGPATPAAGFSRSWAMIHNSVVIQTQGGPAQGGQGSRFVTLTGGGVCSYTAPPAEVVSSLHSAYGRYTRYWAEDGIRIGDTVAKFYNSYPPGNAPYVPNGTVLAMFGVARLSSAGNGPAHGGVVTPQLIPLPSYAPPGAASPVVWGAAVLRAGNTVYVYGTQTPDTPVPDRQLYLARVPASQLGQFAAWQFYAGSGRWSASQPAVQPLQPPDSSLSASSGFSVVQAGTRYWLIQANPIAGRQDIDAYPAGAPWGPFDQAAGIVLYQDPSIGLDVAHDYRIMYEARVVPAVSGSDALVLAYNVNSIGVTTGCAPMTWFTNTVTMPRFVSVPLAMLGQAGGGRDDAVLAGPSGYPRIVARDPAQWFNEWDYPDGCPPLPGVTSVRARPRAGAVMLSWPGAGLGVGYRVYLRPPGASAYVLSTTVSPVLSATARSVSVTLSGLSPGRYLCQVVPVNLRQHTGHMAQVWFTVAGR
jgi:hypothetical protein